ncbi:MAG: DUF1080 domain-containing protein [Bryobacterales bacterium]|nr:DUF1080 domain-containing protein [Bryobacterales bacterium]
MTRYLFRTALLLLAALAAPAQTPDDAQPRVVDPGGPGKAPSDAVVLFDGKDLSEFQTRDGGPVRCSVEGGVILCKTGAGDLHSKRTFRDAQIHLEFMPPYMPEEKGQARGNSGVYLHGRHEIQILDSYNNPTYAHGSCAGLYGQAAPLVNASRPPDQWQSYDIVFRAARCGAGGQVLQKPRVTVFHNGVLVHDHVEIQRTGRNCIEEGPLMLQDHNYKGAPMTFMKFRNIWYRPLEPEPRP